MKLALEVLLSGKRPYLDLLSEELGARLRVESNARPLVKQNKIVLFVNFTIWDYSKNVWRCNVF